MCSTSTTPPRTLDTICTATAPDAVRTLRTNRDATQAGYPNTVLSNQNDPVTSTNAQVTCLATVKSPWGGTSQDGLPTATLAPAVIEAWLPKVARYSYHPVEV
jgi:hypothetical protein